jgi:hypothetical protein
VLTADDIVEITMVLAKYGHVVDDHDWARAHEVFAEDFVFDLSSAGQPDLIGVADVIATFKGRNLYAHVTTNTVVSEDADGIVRAHSKMIGFPNEAAPITGDYHDELIRTPAGWRLHRRRYVVRQRQFFD